jgi:hypothetical protein
LATLRADLGVTAWLVSTVPPDLEILGPDKAPTDLPRSLARPTFEMARFLRGNFTRPTRRRLAGVICSTAPWLTVPGCTSGESSSAFRSLRLFLPSADMAYGDSRIGIPLE